MEKKPDLNRALRRTFWHVYENLGFLILATTLWALLSLTVILMPAVTAAIFIASFDISRDLSPAINKYFKAIPKYFLKSLLVFITFSLLVMLPIFSIKFYLHKFGFVGLFFAGISFWFFVFSAFSSMYSFPLLLRGNGSLKSVKYSYIVFFTNIKFTFLVSIPAIFFLILELFIPFLGIGVYSVFIQNVFLEIEYLYNENMTILEPKYKLKNLWHIWDLS
jgi:hypothetical protein